MPEIDDIVAGVGRRTGWRHWIYSQRRIRILSGWCSAVAVAAGGDGPESVRWQEPGRKAEGGVRLLRHRGPSAAAGDRSLDLVAASRERMAEPSAQKIN